MDFKNFVAEKNFSITVGFNDLKEIVKGIIEDTKRELEESIMARQQEAYVSRQRACEMLDINQSTIFRWGQRNYLKPIVVGGKHRYKMSDINRLLNY